MAGSKVDQRSSGVTGCPVGWWRPRFHQPDARVLNEGHDFGHDRRVFRQACGPQSLLRMVRGPHGFAVAACAFLAASYLTLDARRSGDAGLTRYFRRRAVASGLVVGACSVAGLLVLHAGAPALYGRLTGRALPLVAVAVAAGLASLVLAARGGRRTGRGGRLALLRLTAATAVAAVLWAWGAAQYPFLLRPGLTIAAGAAPAATLQATVIATAVGLALLLPSLAWLLVLFQRPSAAQGPPGRPAGQPDRPAGPSAGSAMPARPARSARPAGQRDYPPR